MSLRNLYLKVSAAVDHLPPSVKADIDAIFASHAELPTPATEPVPTEGETGDEGAGA